MMGIDEQCRRRTLNAIDFEAHRFNCAGAMAMKHEYHLAQRAIADLKAAVYSVLASTSGDGLTNAEIGRSLGIYAGHIEHEGHIPRTLLALMEKEGVVEQAADSKRWSIRRHGREQVEAGA